MRSAALPGAERIPIEGGAHVRLFMIQSSLSLHYCTTGIGSGRNSLSLEARLHMGLQEGKTVGRVTRGMGLAYEASGIQAGFVSRCYQPHRLDHLVNSWSPENLGGVHN